MVCMKRPAIDKPPPAKIAIINRGILNSRIITCELFVGLYLKSVFQKSLRDTEMSPTNKCIEPKIGSNIKSEINTNLFFFVTVIICLMFCKNRVYFSILVLGVECELNQIKHDAVQ